MRRRSRGSNPAAASAAFQLPKRRANVAAVGRPVSGSSASGAVVVWWLDDEEESGLDRERDYLKSFGKYAGTNVAETAAAVGERFDRDLRERRGRRMGGDR